MAQRTLHRGSGGRRRRQRGSVIVEFALVYPILLFTVGMIMSLMMFFWSKYVLLAYATDAVRTCALQPISSLTAVQACAANRASQDISANKPPSCTGGTSINTNVVPLALPGSNPAIQILQVQLTCPSLWSDLIKALPGIPAGNNPMDVRAGAALPFLPNGF